MLAFQPSTGRSVSVILSCTFQGLRGTRGVPRRPEVTAPPLCEPAKQRPGKPASSREIAALCKSDGDRRGCASGGSGRGAQTRLSQALRGRFLCGGGGRGPRPGLPGRSVQTDASVAPGGSVSDAGHSGQPCVWSQRKAHAHVRAHTLTRTLTLSLTTHSRAWLLIITPRGLGINGGGSGLG